MMRVRLLHYIFTFSLFLGSFFFAPNTFATTCACYFGNDNDCSQVFVEDGQPASACKTACEQAIGSTFRHEVFSEATPDPIVAFDCANATSAAASLRAEQARISQNGTPSDVPALETLNPELNVSIPDLIFSPVRLVNNLVVTGFIGDYISGVYRYLVVIAGTLAVMMTMVGGLQYAFGAVSDGQIKKAKARIKNGITGLILVLCAYTLLQVVNPQLVDPRPISLANIDVHDVIANPQNIESPSKTATPKRGCSGPKKESQFHGVGTLDLTLDNFGCGQRSLKEVQFLILHEGSWGHDTVQTLYSRGLSTHYVVRQNGDIVQTMDLHKTAWHAGEINHWAVGVDLELPNNCRCGTWGSCVKSAPNCTYTDEQYAALNKVITLATNLTGVVRDDQHILGHCQIGGHGDPRNFDWSRIGLTTDAHRKEPLAGNCTRVDWEKMVSK